MPVFVVVALTFVQMVGRDPPPEIAKIVTLPELGSKKPRRSKTDRMLEENTRLARRVRALEKRLKSPLRTSHSAETSQGAIATHSPSSEGGSSSSLDPSETVTDIDEDFYLPDFLQDDDPPEDTSIALIKRSDFPVLSERAKRLIPGCKFTLDALYHLYRANGLLEDDVPSPTPDRDVIVDPIKDPNEIQCLDTLSHPLLQDLAASGPLSSVIENETAVATTSEAEPMSPTVFPPPFLESMEDMQQFFNLVFGGL